MVIVAISGPAINIFLAILGSSFYGTLLAKYRLGSGKVGRVVISGKGPQKLFFGWSKAVPGKGGHADLVPRSVFNLIVVRFCFVFCQQKFCLPPNNWTLIITFLNFFFRM